MIDEMENEKAVIEAVLSGDAEAFGDLVRRHQTRIRLVCISFLSNKEEAEDAAQTVFIKAFEALPKFKFDSAFETWIIRIADNHCLDLLRARARRRTESLDALLDEKGDAFDGFLSRFNTADTPPPYTPNELDLVARLFAALPEDDRDILALREMEQLSYEAIAERLHCTLDAVKGRLKRARQNLVEKCRKFFVTLPESPHV